MGAPGMPKKRDRLHVRSLRTKTRRAGSIVEVNGYTAKAPKEITSRMCAACAQKHEGHEVDSRSQWPPWEAKKEVQAVCLQPAHKNERGAGQIVGVNGYSWDDQKEIQAVCPQPAHKNKGGRGR